MYFQMNARNRDMLVRALISNRSSQQELRFTPKDHSATYFSLWQLVNKMEASVRNPIDLWCMWETPPTTTNESKCSNAWNCVTNLHCTRQFALWFLKRIRRAPELPIGMSAHPAIRVTTLSVFISICTENLLSLQGYISIKAKLKKMPTIQILEFRKTYHLYRAT